MTGPFRWEMVIGAIHNTEGEAHSAIGLILNCSAKFASHNLQILDFPNPNCPNVSSHPMEKPERTRVQSGLETLASFVGDEERNHESHE
jgi:hypothetical protein